MRNNFKLIVVVLGIIYLSVFTATAQEYRIEGDKLVKVETAKEKDQPTKTELTVKVKDSIYQVFKSPRGKYFIIRTSKNTGKQYKQYLKVSK